MSNRYLPGDQYTFFVYLARFFLEWVIYQSYKESQDHFYVQSPAPVNRAVYEIMFKNLLEPYTPLITI